MQRPLSLNNLAGESIGAHAHLFPLAMPGNRVRPRLVSCDILHDFVTSAMPHRTRPRPILHRTPTWASHRGRGSIPRLSAIPLRAHLHDLHDLGPPHQAHRDSIRRLRVPYGRSRAVSRILHADRSPARSRDDNEPRGRVHAHPTSRCTSHGHHSRAAPSTHRQAIPPPSLRRPRRL